MHIVDKYMKTGICSNERVLQQEILISPSVGYECNYFLRNGIQYMVALFLPPEQCCVHNALNAGLSLKQGSQCLDKGLSWIIIMIMIVFTEILIFCMFEWREQFTHSPRPATHHRPDSDAGRSNVGPTSGRQHRWQANAGLTPDAARAGGATASIYILQDIIPSFNTNILKRFLARHCSVNWDIQQVRCCIAYIMFMDICNFYKHILE